MQKGGRWHCIVRKEVTCLSAMPSSEVSVYRRRRFQVRWEKESMPVSPIKRRKFSGVVECGISHCHCRFRGLFSFGGGHGKWEFCRSFAIN